MTVVPLDTLRAFVIKAKRSGKMFSVITRKRTDGKLRKFLGRGGVKPPETDKPRREFTPANDNLLTICEIVRGEDGAFCGHQFRSIALEGLVSAKIAGVEYRVE
jgi:hypothetical protein